MNARPKNDPRAVSGRGALLVVLALVLTLAAGITLQAVFADRTGITRRAPVVRFNDAGTSGYR